jgi:hypothetical protein
MTYKSNLPVVMARLRRARVAGLVAAADVLIAAVKRGLQGGFTSGDFATGQLVESVGRTEPDPDRGEIYVGTRWMYALMWELGHINVFSRQFERKEVWVPAFRDNRTLIRMAYARGFRAAMEGFA